MLARWGFGRILAIWAGCIALIAVLILGTQDLRDSNLISSSADLVLLVSVILLALLPIVVSIRWFSHLPHRHWHWGKLRVVIWVVALGIAACVHAIVGLEGWAQHSPWRTRQVVEAELRRFVTAQQDRAQAGEPLLTSDTNPNVTLTPSQRSASNPSLTGPGRSYDDLLKQSRPAFDDLYVDYDAPDVPAFPPGCRPNSCLFTARRGVVLGATDRTQSWSAFARDRSGHVRCGIVVMKSATRSSGQDKIDCSVSS